MRPFLSARTYDGYAFPADDPRDHRIFPICRKVKALSKYNQANQLLEYQTCKDWRRLSLKLTSTPPPPIPPLYNFGNRYGQIWNAKSLGKSHGKLEDAFVRSKKWTTGTKYMPGNMQRLDKGGVFGRKSASGSA